MITLYAPAGRTTLTDRNGAKYTAAADGAISVPASAVADLINQGCELGPGGVSGITNADIAANAAIAKSKLAALAIVNADVDAAAGIASSKLADGPTATPTAGKIAKYDGSGNLAALTHVAVAGVNVLAVQQAAVPDAAGGAIIDAEARTALNALLAAARTHGLIAT